MTVTLQLKHTQTANLQSISHGRDPFMRSLSATGSRYIASARALGNAKQPQVTGIRPRRAACQTSPFSFIAWMMCWVSCASEKLEQSYTTSKAGSRRNFIA